MLASSKFNSNHTPLSPLIVAALAKWPKREYHDPLYANLLYSLLRRNCFGLERGQQHRLGTLHGKQTFKQFRSSVRRYLTSPSPKDEPFHVTQSQAYCRGEWTTWDPKITTPPGLWVASINGTSSGLLMLDLDTSRRPFSDIFSCSNAGYRCFVSFPLSTSWLSQSLYPS